MDNAGSSLLPRLKRVDDSIVVFGLYVALARLATAALCWFLWSIDGRGSEKI
jgi:hypothetical protein